MAENSIAPAAARPIQLPPRQVSGRRLQSMMRSAAFGDMVTILMRAPKHKTLALDALRILLLPAVAHNQYLIARARPKGGTGTIAAGLALWASVSDEVDKRLRTTAQQPLRLSFEEWKSGPHLWLVDLVAPSALAVSMLRDLDDKVAKGRPMTTQTISADGTARLTTVKDLLAGLKTTA